MKYILRRRRNNQIPTHIRKILVCLVLFCRNSHCSIVLCFSPPLPKTRTSRGAKRKEPVRFVTVVRDTSLYSLLQPRRPPSLYLPRCLGSQQPTNIIISIRPGQSIPKSVSKDGEYTNKYDEVQRGLALLLMMQQGS